MRNNLLQIKSSNALMYHNIFMSCNHCQYIRTLRISNIHDRTCINFLKIVHVCVSNLLETSFLSDNLIFVAHRSMHSNGTMAA